MLSRLKKENLFFYGILAILFILLFYICFTAKATFDPGDGLQHYLMSRYSWQHPWLLLDLWAKPVFTLVSSPFAQFGLIGINVFQIVCGIATAYFCYRIAKKLELQFLWLLPIFIFFSPIYFAVLNSGLLEPLFGCALMLIIWLIFEKHFIAAAVVASFLQFIRLEAYAVLPLIGCVLLLRKQFYSILFLFTGFVTYTLIGYLYNGDILWLFHQNQALMDDKYPGGKGELWHYVKHYDEILGTVLSCFLLTGVIWKGYKIFFPMPKSIYTIEETFLIYGSLFACLALHTMMYYVDGIVSNLGMMRYMAVLVPPASIIALRGFNNIPFIKRPYIAVICSTISAALLIMVPFKQWYFPFKLGGEEKVIQVAADWLKYSEFKDEKIYYLHPFLPSTAEFDPYDYNIASQLWGIDTLHPENSIEENGIVFWDAHYAPVEGNVLLEKFMNNPHFVLLKKFTPSEEFTVIGGRKFEIDIFQKKTNQNSSSDVNSSKTLDMDAATWGELSERIEYSPAITKNINTIDRIQEINAVNVRAKILPKMDLDKVFFVCEIRDKNNTMVSWQTTPVSTKANRDSIWKIFETSFILNQKLLTNESSLKFYVWNHGKKSFAIDSIQIKYVRLNDKNIIVND